MLMNRALDLSGSSSTRPNVAPLTIQMDAMVDEGGREGSPTVQQAESWAIGTIRAMANAGGDAMRSMAMDPVSATRQTLTAVRRHPYLGAVLLLGLGGIIVAFARG